ncbi:hypothetical protein AGMMS50212_17110 [Spirochaetia bacterium]|nr:hypothetical protein AGMMS50212_17110 [Spirochaetia bacterium]
MHDKLPDKRALKKDYEECLKEHELITNELEHFIDEILSGLTSQLTVKGRVKSFESFFKKYLRYSKESEKGGEVIIPDQIGIRIVCPFIEDTAEVEKIIGKYFEVLETERKGSGYSFKEFGYESVHILIKLFTRPFTVS